MKHCKTIILQLKINFKKSPYKVWKPTEFQSPQEIWAVFSAVVVHKCELRGVDLYATPWSVTYQVYLSMGFPRQEYWRALPFLSPGDLPDPGIEPVYPALAGRFFTTEPPGKPSAQFSNKFFFSSLEPFFQLKSHMGLQCTEVIKKIRSRPTPFFSRACNEPSTHTHTQTHTHTHTVP